MYDAAFPGAVRADFPVFERRFGGRPLALFDGPAGSQVPRQVVDAVAGYLGYHNSNIVGHFPTAVETEALIRHARQATADFLNAPSWEEVVFGQNMTTLTFALSRAMSRDWGPGDEVVVTELDHQANVAPWRAAAEERGATVRVVPFCRESLTLDYAALEAALSERTRVVAVGYASNAVGTVNDVARVVALAREVGAQVFVDAVHFAPHGLIDVEALGCDFLACSSYKFFGPHMGILWGKRDHLDHYRPYKVPPSPEASPDRWETGTLSHEGIAGICAAVEWIAGLTPEVPNRRAALAASMERIGRHESALFARLLDEVSAIPGVRTYGPPRGAPRTPTLAFTLEGYHPDAVAKRLAEQGVCVWSGDFYASTVIAGLGLADRGGVVRAGIAPYVDADDVSRLVKGVRALASAR